MTQVARWLLAGLVTLAAFAGVTWLFGGLVLLVFGLDADLRWSIAGGAGVATAALAALWGQGFATRSADDTGDVGRPPTTAGPENGGSVPDGGNVRNEIKGGVSGQVVQGRDFYGPLSFGSAEAPRDADGDLS